MEGQIVDTYHAYRVESNMIKENCEDLQHAKSSLPTHDIRPTIGLVPF